MFEARDNPASPLREYEVPREARPPYYNAVFEPLERAAQRARNMYLSQRTLLDPVLDQLDDIAKDDKLARNPYTVPDDSGRFVFMHDHPEFEDDRRLAQEDIRRAIRNLNYGYGQTEITQYLSLLANSLDKIDRESNELIRRSFVRQRENMSFMVAPVEEERRKIWWEGYLGFIDEPRTTDIQEEIDRFRTVAMERPNEGFKKNTIMRFEYAAVMAGRLGKRAVSAKNSSVPDDDYRRITIFSGPFWQAYDEKNLTIAQRYVVADLLPTYDGTLSFLSGHEFSHNENDPSRLGELTQPMREAAANFSAIDLAAKDMERKRLPEESLVECIMGAVGYCLADCDELLRAGRPLPDAVALGRRTVYDLGSSVLLYKLASEGGFVINDGLITSVDSTEVVRIARDLYQEESALLQSGSFARALRHFDDNLPRGPFSLDKFRSYAAA